MQVWIDELKNGGARSLPCELLVCQPLAQTLINSFCHMESFKLRGELDHFSKVYTFPLAFDALFLHARFQRTLARLDDAMMLTVGRICGVTSSANG